MIESKSEWEGNTEERESEFFLLICSSTDRIDDQGNVGDLLNEEVFFAQDSMREDEIVSPLPIVLSDMCRLERHVDQIQHGGMKSDQSFMLDRSFALRIRLGSVRFSSRSASSRIDIDRRDSRTNERNLSIVLKREEHLTTNRWNFPNTRIWTRSVSNSFSPSFSRWKKMSFHLFFFFPLKNNLTWTQFSMSCHRRLSRIKRIVKRTLSIRCAIVLVSWVSLLSSTDSIRSDFPSRWSLADEIDQSGIRDDHPFLYPHAVERFSGQIRDNIFVHHEIRDHIFDTEEKSLVEKVIEQHLILWCRSLEFEGVRDENSSLVSVLDPDWSRLTMSHHE